MLARKPDAGNLHVRFDEGGQRDWRQPPAALYSTATLSTQPSCTRWGFWTASAAWPIRPGTGRAVTGGRVPAAARSPETLKGLSMCGPSQGDSSDPARIIPSDNSCCGFSRARTLPNCRRCWICNKLPIPTNRRGDGPCCRGALPNIIGKWVDFPGFLGDERLGRRFRVEERPPRFHTVFITGSLSQCTIPPCFTDHQDKLP